ncbi:MAG: hypothetical protein C0504_10685 [Candidatus Solibacter sp.]|nr:hypothetical protein [Candidatus Solibacter sp.]
MRPARDRGLLESLLALAGFQPARCHHCAHRFLARPFGFAKLRWAKCPRCYRMDLSIWDPKYYHIGGWTSLKFKLGANRWRCEACRCNFASFRPRQRKYVRPESGAPPDADD